MSAGGTRTGTPGRGGFDVFVGNPPFAGKNTLQESQGPIYGEWLKTIHEESHGNADLVAHFFRRSFDLLKDGGAMGLVATNTIAQGDTRSTGLRWIAKHGGVIYDARRRYKWPGVAAVIVSVVHVAKRGPDGAEPAIERRLDGKVVERISAFLFHQGGDEDPVALQANAGKSFQGSIVLGMGFTFDDTNPKATSIAEMHRLIAKDPRNAERIFPYLGGEELNTSPTHAHHRHVINFGQMTEEEARSWPDLMAIVETKVKPERMKLGDNADAKRRKQFWWQWGRYTPALFDALEPLDSALAIARVSDTFAFARVGARAILSDKIVILPSESDAVLAALQSRVHESWGRYLNSSLKDDMQYTPSLCFETFPFPAGWETSLSLEDAGRRYHEHRAALMIANDQGLTATYNRFHDPDERDPGILELRRLHDVMDRAVLDAYGWTDLHPTCTFLLDHDDGEDEESAPTIRKAKKKPWRYRWPDEVRDDVLARLLALNAERAREEALLGEAAAAARTTAADGGKPRSKRARSAG